MKPTIFKKLLTLLAVMMMSNLLFAQAMHLKIDPSKSSITIHGTSNVHDWDTWAKNIGGEFSMNASKQIQSLIIKIPVKSIKSGNGLMDDKTHDAFNVDKFPLITFQITEPITPALNAEKDVVVTMTGNLNMAGVTKRISFKSVGKPGAAGVYTFTASFPIKLSDYKMTPPVAMFGALTTGDLVALKLNIVLIAQAIK